MQNVFCASFLVGDGCSNAFCMLWPIGNGGSHKQRELEVPYLWGMPLIARCKRPKCFWKCLHRQCKPQKPLFTSCTTGANRKNYYLALAPSVQIEKAAFEPLHRWCKSQKPLFSPCTTGASHEKYFLVVAPPVQAFPKTFWSSRGFRRSSLLTSNSR